MPTGPSTTNVYYEVYRNKHSSEEQFQQINTIYKRIMSEDKSLCVLAQKNLNAGVFLNGELHPHIEKGALYFQKLCRKAVYEWHKKEKAAGKEVWPARQTLPSSAGISNEDVDFCNSLSCSSTKEELAW